MSKLNQALLKFDLDQIIFRLIFIAAFFAFGGGIITYLIVWIIIPDRYF